MTNSRSRWPLFAVAVIVMVWLVSCTRADSDLIVDPGPALATAVPTTAPILAPPPVGVVGLLEPLGGVVVPAPDGNLWQPSEVEAVATGHQWTLAGTEFTIMSIEAFPGAVLDDMVAEQRGLVGNQQSEPADWLKDVSVPGANRSVLVTHTIGAQSHSYVRILLIETCTHTIKVLTRLWEPDIAIAPFEEMSNFIDAAVVTSSATRCHDHRQARPERRVETTS